MKDLNIDNLILHLKTDNASVEVWLSRSDARHWVNIKCINEQRLIKTLDNIAEMCTAYNIKLDVELIKSEDNPADALSRFPKNMLPAVAKPELDIEKLNNVKLMMNREQVLTRDQFGRVIVNDEEAKQVLTKLPASKFSLVS
jgi:hypothetical protein